MRMEKVVRYNLAFLLPHLIYPDNGRVLGFDNAHGVHERHFMGTVQEVEFESYQRHGRPLLSGGRGDEEKL